MPHEYIDAHHHLWRYSEEEYPWMLAGMEAIRRDFLSDELKSATQAAAITGSVAIQARQKIEETEWLLHLAGSNDLIRGVVGWVPLAEPGIGAHLETFSSHPKLKGVRHVLHDEADDYYMLRDDFNQGISLLKNFKLTFDILIFDRHLPQTGEFVDRHPNEVFVLDHIAKPRIKQRERTPWSDQITALAQRQNVYCKLSGMVTEADWTRWTEKDLYPYFDIVLNAFGPRRLMFGSDWPVMLVACDYIRWVNIVLSWISELSATEQVAIMADTAKAAYSL
jgi:L-fuconolactonase